MTTKTNDCVELVEQIQEQIQAKLGAMSREEQVAFWRTKTEEMRQRQKQAKERHLSHITHE